VLGQLQLADDLGEQQADDIRRDGEPEPGHDLLGHRRAAEHVPTLEHDRPEPGPCQVRGAHEAVVAPADDDRVVALGHLILLDHVSASATAAEQAASTVPSLEAPVYRAPRPAARFTTRYAPGSRTDLG
jgi:hypothetical protein